MNDYTLNCVYRQIGGLVGCLGRNEVKNAARMFVTRNSFCLLMHMLATYLLTVDKFNYVLFRKFQTDSIEFRFSQCRQLSGVNYHVSVMESEKKLKIASILCWKSAKCSNFSLHQFLFECKDDIDKNSEIPLAMNL